MKIKSRFALASLFVILPLTVCAEEALTTQKIEKQAEDYLSLVNGVKHHSGILIKKVGVNTDTKDIAFSYNRFTVYNDYATCEMVYGNMAYEPKKGSESDKIIITSITQDSNSCEFRNGDYRLKQEKK